MVVQVLLALSYYLGLVAVMRMAGKRLAGQVTTFDLVVLITLGVVLQSIALRPGRVSFEALDNEGLSYEELLAGLRKLGCAGPWEVGLATLEETGHISVIPLGKAGTDLEPGGGANLQNNQDRQGGPRSGACRQAPSS